MAEEKKSESTEDHFVNDTYSTETNQFEGGILYNPDPPFNLNINRSNTAYKFVPKWYRRHQMLLYTLFATEQYQIIQAVHISYRWRFNAVKNKRYTIQFVDKVWSTSMVDYKVPLFELYKRLAVKQGKFSSNAAKSMDFSHLNNNELKRFKCWLLDKSYIFDPTDRTKRIDLFSIKLDKNKVEYIQLTANKVTRWIIQLINTLGMAMEKMNVGLESFIKLHQRNKHATDKFIFS